MTSISLFMLFVITIGSSIPQSVATSHDVFIPEVTVSVTAISKQANESIWMLPGPRSLDPALFGTPADPLKTNWLPVSMRNTTQDGTAFTTTAGMTPFSNNTKSITGNLSLSVKDVTELDSMTSLDEASVDVNFTGPMGINTYRIVLKQLLPVGPDHRFFGGVGSNIYMHGETEIGTPLMPASISYVTLWGVADLYINDSLVDSMRVLHIMVSQRMRTPDFQLGFGVANPDEIEIHVIMPNTKVNMTTGPFDDAVPTQFTLPNGMDQPFLHVNFYNMVIERSVPTVTGDGTTTVTTTIVQTSTTTVGDGDTNTDDTPGFVGYLTIVSFFIALPIYNHYRRRK
ncbi:MAG: hypothetical protein GPJ54_03850 [Candidatus Heimdallarchaeota archaeon]|nr:hypothetical protein [Candidatus Heimdallarchaeota archaeon]